MSTFAVGLTILSISAACGSGDQRHTREADIASGDALSGASTQTQGVFTYPDPKLTVEYWFAFPLITNASQIPVTIEKFALVGVDKGIRVVGYTNVDVSTQGLDGDVPTVWDTSKPFPPDPPGLDLRDARFRTSMPFSIKSKATSPTVGVARLRLINETAVNETRTKNLRVSGCAVFYKQADRQYRQVLPCEFLFGEP